MCRLSGDVYAVIELINEIAFGILKDGAEEPIWHAIVDVPRPVSKDASQRPTTFIHRNQCDPFQCALLEDLPPLVPRQVGLDLR